jgi:hypothetical protein
MNAVGALTDRLALLDGCWRHNSATELRTLSPGFETYGWTESFVDIMSACNPGSISATPSDRAIEPNRADQLVAGADVTRRLREDEPALLGPLDAGHQQWVGVKSWGRGELTPSRRYFRTTSRAYDEYAVQPPRVGFYTSTTTTAGPSLWRVLIERDAMYLPPVQTWRMELEDRTVRIAEMTSAAAWVALVEAFPIQCDGTVYPDWHSLAQNFDAIHFTVPMIVAAQGFGFRVGAGVIPPGYWDVETTFWLNWAFSDATLVEAVDT